MPHVAQRSEGQSLLQGYLKGEIMQELQDGITRAIRDESGQAQIELLDVSKAWALYSLETYTGDLLTRALEISRALADFTLELKEPGHGR